MTRNELLAQLGDHKETWAAMGVRSLAVFGSVARGKEGPDSDVDLLVEFSRPVGLFEFVRLKNRLEQLLGCDVDLVTPDALRASMKQQILEEAVYVTSTLGPAP